jgi:hypothetical protein
VEPKLPWVSLGKLGFFEQELQANLDELLFAMIVLGDDRLIERTVISQGI